MNLQILICLLITLIHAVHSQGTYEDCCLKYHKHVSPAILHRIRGYMVQEVNGSCNRPAIIFVFPKKNNVICGNPKDKWVQRKMKDLKRQRNINKEKVRG